MPGEFVSLQDADLPYMDERRADRITGQHRGLSQLVMDPCGEWVRNNDDLGE